MLQLKYEEDITIVVHRSTSVLRIAREISIAQLDLFHYLLVMCIYLLDVYMSLDIPC